MKAVCSFAKYLYEHLEKIAIILFFSGMVIISGFTVISRYFFAFTFSWAEQLARIFFVIVTFAGISLAARKGAHLKVTALTSFFPGKFAEILMIFGDLVSVVFGFLVSYEIFKLVLLQMRTGQTFAAIPGLPMWVMYLPGTIFLILFSIRIIHYGLVPGFRKLAAQKGADKP